MLNADLEEVGAQLEPVVEEEADGDEGPHGREERQVPELDHHLGDVFLDIVGLERRLVAHDGEEDKVLRVVLAEVSQEGILDARGAVFVVPPTHALHDEGEQELLAEVRHPGP